MFEMDKPFRLIGGYNAIIHRQETYVGSFDIVLAEWLKEGHAEWVTWMYDTKVNKFHWGHYFLDEQKAIKDFEARLRGEGLK